MKRSVIVVIGATLFFAALGLDYVLPQVSVVEVVGVEVKRSDEEQGTRDVYIIHTQLIDGGLYGSSGTRTPGAISSSTLRPSMPT